MWQNNNVLWFYGVKYILLEILPLSHVIHPGSQAGKMCKCLVTTLITNNQ